MILLYLTLWVLLGVLGVYIMVEWLESHPDEIKQSDLLPVSFLVLCGAVTLGYSVLYLLIEYLRRRFPNNDQVLYKRKNKNDN